MAGPVSDLALPNSSFFNIYHDGTPVAPRASPRPAPTAAPSAFALPTGQCNFVDLALGANGPKCGCRRFWGRGVYSSNQSASGGVGGVAPSSSLSTSEAEQAAWCMCNHHACFHDDIQESQAPFMSPVAQRLGQENERPWAGAVQDTQNRSREPLTPVGSAFPRFPMPSANLLSAFHGGASLVGNVPAGNVPAEENHVMTGIQVEVEVAPQGREHSLPSLADTLSWNNFGASQSGPVPGPSSGRADAMPPIPSQCLLSSQPSSTTSSARINYMRPFGGKGLHTLNVARSKLRTPLQECDEDVVPQDGQDGEPRETRKKPRQPSVGASADEIRTVTNTPRSCRREDVPDLERIRIRLGPNLADFRELSNIVQAHENRIDRLETVSFSGPGHDECHEKHDGSDLRLTDMEVRVEELEKALHDSHGRTRCGHAVESSASMVSVSTTASSRAELANELQDLKAQLSRLQSLSFPTYSRPWEVEVVFLPFPLQGCWVESHDFPSQRVSGGAAGAEPDQWTQLPMTYSHSHHSTPMGPPTPHFQKRTGPESGPESGLESGLESEPDWLLPRACAPDRLIEQRLRSRGLIQKVAIRGPDARSVQQAVSEAFGSLLRTLSRPPANVVPGSATHRRMNQFLGLQQPWVPLRKIHRDTRLRFLSPAEMVTPAMWDVSFLRTSVVMKAPDVHRLFLTQPEAYLQDAEAYACDRGWTWRRLRELSRVYPDSQSSQQDVPEADAMEACWMEHEKLDDPSPSQSTLSSIRQAAQPRPKSISRSPSQVHFLLGQGQSPSLSLTRSRGPSPAVLRRANTNGSWTESQSKDQSNDHPLPPPLHLRTNSMPPAPAPSVSSPNLIKRRVSSGTHSAISNHRSSSQGIRVPPPSALNTGNLAGKRRRGTRSPSHPVSARLRHTPRWSTVSPGSSSPANFGALGIHQQQQQQQHLHHQHQQQHPRQPTPGYYATPYSNAPFADDRGSGTDEARHSSQEDVEELEDRDSEGDSEMVDLSAAHPKLLRSTTNVYASIHDPAQSSSQAAQIFARPEDEPWPGIEDEDDEENRDPEALAFGSEEEVMVGMAADEGGDEEEDDAMSEGVDVELSCARAVDGKLGVEEVGMGLGRGLGMAGDEDRASSVPSEYPSTERAWVDGADFEVFEDP